MRDWPGYDPTAVRATELASAAAVVTQFRRRRRATVAAALSVAVITSLSSRVMYGGATSSLEPTTGTPATSPADRADRVAVPPTAAPTAPPVLPGAPAADGDAGRGAGGVAPAVVDAVPRGYEAGEPAGDARRRAPSRVRVARRFHAGQQCDINWLPTQAALCSKSSGAQEKPGGAVTLRYTACVRAPSLATATLNFTTSQEVDFVVMKGTKALWRWSTGQRFARNDHGLELASGQCVEWRTLWNGELDDGTRVRAGTYTVRAVSTDVGKRLPKSDARFKLRV